MKDKNIAGILALFFGGLGVHRFYLGQIGLGIFYIFFFWIMWLVALIDAIAFFSMDAEEFNRKYNREYLRGYRDTDFSRDEYRQREKRDYRQQRRTQQRQPAAPVRQRRPRGKRPNPFKQSGIEKYKDFEYQAAIKDFEKALEIDPKDIAVHFNLACALSLTEKAQKSFEHLDKAVEFGFNDFQRIKEHDALAYLRIQPAFEEFEKNGFRLVQRIDPPKDDILSSAPSDLLEQLRRLGDLREKGLLTEEEFATQKKRLLDNS